MKKILGLLLFLLNFKLQAEPCSVDLYSKIYTLEKNQSLTSKEAIHTNNCSDTIIKQIVANISKKSDVIYSSQIEKELDLKDVHITPRKIFISELSSLFHEQLTANSNLFFLDIKSLNGIRSISLTEGEFAKSNCESCTSFGEKNIKIEIADPLNSTARALWFSSKIFAKIKVFKAKHTLSFQTQSFGSEDFVAEETLTMMPDSILGSLENIRFYKPNKTILQGSIVTMMDIQPVNLVNYGTPVKAILKNSVISLTKMAEATRSAQFGESVELKVGNNKTITGKVIDYNKVVIEL